MGYIKLVTDNTSILEDRSVCEERKHMSPRARYDLAYREYREHGFTRDPIYAYSAGKAINAKNNPDVSSFAVHFRDKPGGYTMRPLALYWHCRHESFLRRSAFRQQDEVMKK